MGSPQGPHSCSSRRRCQLEDIPGRDNPNPAWTEETLLKVRTKSLKRVKLQPRENEEGTGDDKGPPEEDIWGSGGGCPPSGLGVAPLLRDPRVHHMTDRDRQNEIQDGKLQAPKKIRRTLDVQETTNQDKCTASQLRSDEPGCQSLQETTPDVPEDLSGMEEKEKHPEQAGGGAVDPGSHGEDIWGPGDIRAPQGPRVVPLSSDPPTTNPDVTTKNIIHVKQKETEEGNTDKIDNNPEKEPDPEDKVVVIEKKTKPDPVFVFGSSDIRERQNREPVKAKRTVHPGVKKMNVKERKRISSSMSVWLSARSTGELPNLRDHDGANPVTCDTTKDQGNVITSRVRGCSKEEPEAAKTAPCGLVESARDVEHGSVKEVDIEKGN